jgi:hypothetical protein
MEAASLRSKYTHYKELYTGLYAAAQLTGCARPPRGGSTSLASPPLRGASAERRQHGSRQAITPGRAEADGNCAHGGSEHMPVVPLTALPMPSVSPSLAAEQPAAAAPVPPAAAACAAADFEAALRPDGGANAALGDDAQHADADAVREGMHIDVAPHAAPSPERVAPVLPPCADDPIVDATQCCDRAARGLPCEHTAARAPPPAFQPVAAAAPAAPPHSSELLPVIAPGKWRMRNAAVARSNMEDGVGVFLSDVPLLPRPAAPGEMAGSGETTKKKPRLQDGANTSNIVDDFLFSTPSGPPALPRAREGVENRPGAGGDCAPAPRVASPPQHGRTNWSLEPRRKGKAAAGQEPQPAGGAQRAEPAAVAGDVRDVERRRTVRAEMQTFECAECSRFYDALGLPTEEAAKRACRCAPAGGGEVPMSREGVRQHVGRHRAHWQPALTPAGFWNLGFDPTQQPAGSGMSNGQSQERVGWGLPP